MEEVPINHDDDWEAVASVAYNPESGQLHINVVGGGVTVTVYLDDALNPRSLLRMKETLNALPGQTLEILKELISQVNPGLLNNPEPAVHPTIYSPGE